MWKLKQENEKLVETSRGKETESQALQETNMRLSLVEKKNRKILQWQGCRFRATTEKKINRTGRDEELNLLSEAGTSLQQETVTFQQEGNEVTLALEQKQMENRALEKDSQYFVTSKYPLTRSWRDPFTELRDHKILLCHKLGLQKTEQLTSEGKSGSSSNVMEKASHRARL